MAPDGLVHPSHDGLDWHPGATETEDEQERQQQQQQGLEIKVVRLEAHLADLRAAFKKEKYWVGRMEISNQDRFRELEGQFSKRCSRLAKLEKRLVALTGRFDRLIDRLGDCFSIDLNALD